MLRPLLALGTATLAVATPALAQNGAAQQGLPSREEVRPPALQQDNTIRSRLTVDGGLERAPCPLAEDRFAGITVTLDRIDFAGLQEVDPALLAPAYAQYIGKTVPIAAVCDIRDSAATILRREGYLAAIQVPPQRIEGGVLKLDVLMAKLVGLQIRGQTGHSEALLASYLERLKDGRPFNQRRAERALLLARDLPGYDVRLTLRPAGTVPGEVVGDVVVTRIPFTLDVAVQNLGSPSVGRSTVFVRGEAYDLLGAGDRLSLGLFNTLHRFREQTVVQAGYDAFLGADGFALGGNFTYAWTHPSLGGGDPLRARTLAATVQASYPLVRTLSETVRVAGGLDLIEQRLRFAGTPLTTDKLRVAFLRADISALDRASIGAASGYTPNEPHWLAAGSFELRKGLDVLGASDRCGAAPLYLKCLLPPALSRLDGDPSATLVRFSGTFEWRPVPDIAFSLSPRAQYAFDPVVAYEEYSGGSYTIGRGYDPGIIAADSGVGFAAEVRGGSLVTKGVRDLVVQPFAFFDAAWAYNRGSIPTLRDPQRLYSIGGGVRAAFADKMRLDLTVAAPLERNPLVRDRDVRVLVSLTTRILPWSAL